MSKKKKPTKSKEDKVKMLIAIASLITSVSALLNVIFDFIIKLLK